MSVFGGTSSPVLLARKRLIVIAVASQSGAGKGKVCKLLAEKLEGTGRRCQITSSSTQIRLALSMPPDATRDSIRLRLASISDRPSGFPMSLYMPSIARRDLLHVDSRPDVRKARIVDGIRLLEQYELLQELYFGATLSLLWVDRAPEKCINALVERDEITKEEARSFISGEMTGDKPLINLRPVREKASDHIDNNGTLEELEREVESYLAKLLAQLPQASSDAVPDRYGEHFAAVWIRNHPPTGNAA